MTRFYRLRPVHVIALGLLACLLTAAPAAAQGAQLAAVSSTDGGCISQSGSTWSIQPGKTYEITINAPDELEPRTLVTIVTSSGIIEAWAQPLGGDSFRTDPMLIPAGFCGTASLRWGDFSLDQRQPVTGTLQAATFAAGCASPTPISCSSGCRPIVSCPDLRVSADADQCSAVVNYPAPTITGGCTIQSITFHPPSGSRLPGGSNLVTCTVTAVGGQTTFATFDVQVMDDTAVTVTCPVLDPVTADANCQAVIPDITRSTSLFDNCFPVIASTRRQRPGAGTVVGVGTHTVTVEALGFVGQVIGTGTTTFTVLPSASDTEPPTVTCPAPVTLTADGTCQAAIPNLATGLVATDDCTPAGQLVVKQNPSAGTLVGPGSHTVIIGVLDAAGNKQTCSVTITVVDDTPPVISSPKDILVATDAGLCTASVPLILKASDNCDTALAPVYRIGDQVIASPHDFPVGTTVVTGTFTDSAGLTASASFSVTVEDREAPFYSETVSAATDPGRCTALVSLPSKARENCKNYTLLFKIGDTVITSPHEFTVGTTNVTVVATDASGNSATYTLPVTVQDGENPTISCPPGKIVTAAPGECTASVPVDLPHAGDNCGAPTVSGSRSDGQPLDAPFPVGPTTITWTATDGAGNQATCSQIVTVEAVPGVPAEQVRRALQAAIAEVERLVATRVLRPVDGAVLTAVLRLALQVVNQHGDRLTPAHVEALRQYLQSFISGVNSLVSRGRLTAAQGAALVAAAQAVITALGSPCP